MPLRSEAGKGIPHVGSEKGVDLQLLSPQTPQHLGKHKHPHHHYASRQHTPKQLQSLTVERSAQCLGSRHLINHSTPVSITIRPGNQDETQTHQRSVRKHKREPRHLEAQLALALGPQVLPQGPDRDEEEPHAQPPQPEADHVRKQAERVGSRRHGGCGRWRARRHEEVRGEDGGGLRAELDWKGVSKQPAKIQNTSLSTQRTDGRQHKTRTYSRAGKPTRPNRNKHTRPLVVARQLLRHEAVQEGGADHEADEETGALDGDRREGDGHSADGRQAARAEGCPDQVAAQRRRKEQRVGWEDPDGGHGVDWEDSGGGGGVG